jgi:hypothetical protein
MDEQTIKEIKGVFSKNEWQTTIDACYDHPIVREYHEGVTNPRELKTSFFLALRGAEHYYKTFSKANVNVDIVIEKMDWFPDKNIEKIILEIEEMIFEAQKVVDKFIESVV